MKKKPEKKKEKKKKPQQLSMYIHRQNTGVLFLFSELTLGPKIKAYLLHKILDPDSLYTVINNITSTHITDSRPDRSAWVTQPKCPSAAHT